MEIFFSDYTSLQSPSVGNSVADKESPHKLCLEYKQLKKINFFCCCFSPRDIRIQTVSYNISLVCLVCAVQLLLLDFVALPGFWLVGIWQRRKLNSCSFSKQEVIKLNWVFSRWISWKGHDPRGNDAACFRQE